MTAASLPVVERVIAIPRALIRRHPLNRTEFDPGLEAELDVSMRAEGQIMPAIVRPLADGTFQLIAGERRFRSCERVGIEHLKCLVREYSDAAAAAVLLKENLERENLSPLAEAGIYRRALEMVDGQGLRLYSLEKIALEVHHDARKVSHVARTLKLLDLPEFARKALAKGELRATQAFMVARLADPRAREDAGKFAISHKFHGRPATVQELAVYIEANHQVCLNGSPIDLEDAGLLSDEALAFFKFTGAPGGENDGSCARCPWLARNHPAYADQLKVRGGGRGHVGSGQVGIEPLTCLRVGCHQAKREVLWQRAAISMIMRIPEGAGIVPLSEGGAALEAGQTPYVVLEGRPSAADLNADDEASVTGGGPAPRWEKILEGAGVPLLVAADGKGAPVLVVRRDLALAAAKESPEHAALFAKVSLPAEGEGAGPVRRAAAAARKAEAKVTSEVQVECMRALWDCLVDGMGIEEARLFFFATWRHVDDPGRALMAAVLRMPSIDQLEAFAQEMSAPMLAATAVLAVIADDVVVSGIDGAEDFVALCESEGVKVRDIDRRMRRRIAQETKAAAPDKPKRARKVSTDQVDWSAEKEAERTRAGDAVEKAGA